MTALIAQTTSLRMVGRKLAMQAVGMVAALGLATACTTSESGGPSNQAMGTFMGAAVGGAVGGLAFGSAGGVIGGALVDQRAAEIERAVVALQGDVDLVRRALQLDPGDSSPSQLVHYQPPDAQILMKLLRVVALRIPLRFPIGDDSQTKSNRIHLASH